MPATTFSNTGTVYYQIDGVDYTDVSNAVVSTKKPGKFTLLKSQSRTDLSVGEVQEYTVVVTNTTGVNIPVFSKFIDELPAGMTYVPNSFKYDGVLSNPVLTGNQLLYTVGAWNVGVSHTFVFQCTVNP